MHVFRICWKLMIHAWKATLLYLSLIIAIVLLVKGNLFSNQEETFSKIPIYLINEDEGSILSKEFVQYIDKYVSYVEKNIETESQMKEQLIYEGVDCVIHIPANFSTEYLAGNGIKLERFQLFETNDTVFLELIMNQFASIFEESFDKSLSLDQMIEVANQKLSFEVKANIHKEEQPSNVEFMMYLKYLSYVVFSIIMSLTGSVILSLRKDIISKRNEIAPIRSNMIYKEAALAIVLMSLLLTTCLIFFGIYFTKVNLENTSVTLMCLNMLLYSGFCASTSFLLAAAVRTPKRIELFEQIIALGTSFFGGVFVAQDLMPKSILDVSKIFPSYWFVKTNNELSTIDIVSFHDYQQFVIQGGIVLLYTLILFIIALIIAEKKVKLEL